MLKSTSTIDTANDFSSTHSPCKQRREPLGTCYPSIHSRTMNSLNSMGMRKCRGDLQTTLSLGIPNNSSPLEQVYFHSIFIIGKILPNSHSVRVGMTFNKLDWLSSTCVINRKPRILYFSKTPVMQVLVKMYSLHPISRSSLETENPNRNTIPLDMQGSIKICDLLQ